MSSTLSRRQLLRTSVAAAAGMALVRPVQAVSRMENSLIPHKGEDGLIWLDQNENPYGISEDARKVIINSVVYSNRYPDEIGKELVNAIADREGVTSEHIILGAGSSEILCTAGYLYGAEGGEVVCADPAYHGFMNYISHITNKLVRIPLTDTFEHDLDAMARRTTNKTSLVYICNPNNPTGTIVDSAKLRSFCEDVSKRTLVMVDEAYNELVIDKKYESMIDLVKNGSDIIILRTFSKVFGLAGLRVGYGIAHPDIIANVKRVQGNIFPISTLSLHAALASYKDTGFIEYTRVNNAKSQSYLYDVLDRLGYFYISSRTNFVLFKSELDSLKFVTEIRKRNVVIRPFYHGGENFIRVSMGTLPEMAALADALEDVT